MPDQGPADRMAGSRRDRLWAVSAYFNPCGYRRRLSNYRTFRQQLSVPLLTVELGFGGRFDLTAADADLLIQLPGRDILWHKERLLNIAVGALPAEVTQAAWLDCDVVFERGDWSQLASQALDDYPLLQLYTEIVRLPRHSDPGAPMHWESYGEPRPAVCSLISSQANLRRVCLDFPRLPGRALPGPIGFGWAFRREIIERHAFYDAGILGGGDLLLVAGLAGLFDLGIEQHQMNPAAAAHYLRWAQPLYEQIGQNVSCLPGRIGHLWHGELRDRGYETRYAELREFDFNPDRDIARDEHGVWQWNSDKPAMHRFVSSYFSTRCEDG